MKEEALDIISAINNPAQKLNVLREYIQTLTLRSLHESEAFMNLSFVGGTALRFAHALPRFSEDLDFTLENGNGYNPEIWLKKVKTDLRLNGYDASVSFKNKTTVHKSWIKIAGILKDAGLAAMQDQKLSIKLEIDTKPPHGAICERSLVTTHHRMLALRCYNLPSLMAGKINALCTRKYAKGRDWYDLLWYLGQRPAVNPNLRQLQNAFNQTYGADTMHAAQWKNILITQINKLDCNVLQRDIYPFLEHQREYSLLTETIIKTALKETA